MPEYTAVPCREQETRMCPIHLPCKVRCFRFGFSTHNIRVARTWGIHYAILADSKNKIDRSYIA